MRLENLKKIEAKPLVSAEQVASNRQSLLACAESLNHFSRVGSKPAGAILANLAQVVHDASRFDEICADDEAIGIILKVSILHLDRLHLDDMSPTVEPYPGNSPYFRSLGFRPWNESTQDMWLRVPKLNFQYFVTPIEADALWQKVLRRTGLKPTAVNSFREARGEIRQKLTSGDKQAIIIRGDISLDEARVLGKELEDTHCYDYVSMFARIKISEKMTILVQLGFGHSLTGFAGKITNLSHQAIWLETLKSGQVIFSLAGTDNEHLSPPSLRPSHIDKEELDRKLAPYLEGQFLPTDKIYERGGRRRGLVSLALSKDKLQERHERLEKFYCRNFGHEHPVYGSPKVVLTRSGVGANLLATRLAQALGPGTGISRAIPGWYYETLGDIRETSLVRKSLGVGDVFYLNAEPNDPNATDWVKEDWGSYREKVIRRAIEEALKNPQDEIFLVIDRTTDLNWDYSCLLKKAPKNLYLIETASLTKHQRGEKNFFFGVVWLYGPDLLEKHLPSSVALSTLELDEYSLAFFPEVTTGQIEKRQNTVRDQLLNFENEVNHQMARLPAPLRWTVEKYNCFGYLKPPTAALMAEFEAKFCQRFGNDLTDKTRQMIRSYAINSFIGAFLPLWSEKLSEALKKSGIVGADSFGLSEDRYTFLTLESPHTNTQISTLRISPGIYAKDEKKYRLAGLEICRPIIELMLRFNKGDFWDRLWEVALINGENHIKTDGRINKIPFVIP